MIAPLRNLSGAIAKKGGIRNLARILSQMAEYSVFSALYVHWLRLCGVQVGRGCLILGWIRISGDPRRITIGDRCIVHPGVVFWTHDYGEGHGRIVLGTGVSCLRGVMFNSYESITVGALTAFGDGCYVQDNDHGTEPGIPIMKQRSRGEPIVIGEDVWFGARCIVLKGVSIGDHTIVGAGSVVVKSLPANAVAVGVPCRPIKTRGVATDRAA